MGEPYSSAQPPPAQQQQQYDYNYNYPSAYHDQHPPNYQQQQHYGYPSQCDVTQIPRSHPDEAGGGAPPAPNQQQQPPPRYYDYDYDYDHNRLGPQYEPPRPPPPHGIVRQGSSAEYYNQSQHDLAQPQPVDHEGADNPESSDRGLGGAILGGTTGFYLGHKKSHGLLGAVGGAILGSLMENKLKEARGKEDHDGSIYGGGGGGGSAYGGGVITGMGMDMGIITTITTIGIIGIGIIGVRRGGVVRGMGRGTVVGKEMGMGMINSWEEVRVGEKVLWIYQSQLEHWQMLKENDDTAEWDITIVAAGALQQFSATWTLVRWLDRNLGEPHLKTRSVKDKSNVEIGTIDSVENRQ
ncbi:uncharacterized protein BO72DRAFT_489388 [Aspergillus fijiensis CBS 313.89]|uniref:Glycine zipper 2TM domain-containing protein n=1 Tax=Aspergillus fijiensis CBS 313.89 TaxID=1448319 RepID=A0A8G1RJP6_9EURO|nr:uncharacterized protein BO72DRAFT_489388 [Aspergillus fijiensis CBS 313.89]RAK72985.1 hypothetical protein BO72DRAFT_489388 [Aspergillus fijiensis CBS 313.89]